MLALEGHVGHPHTDMPCTTLWKGVQLVDDRLRVLKVHVQGTLNTNIQQAWAAVTTGSERDWKALAGQGWIIFRRMWV